MKKTFLATSALIFCASSALAIDLKLICVPYYFQPAGTTQLEPADRTKELAVAVNDELLVVKSVASAEPLIYRIFKTTASGIFAFGQHGSGTSFSLDRTTDPLRFNFAISSKSPKGETALIGVCTRYP